MSLNLKIEWSELILERGKLDPLSLWRVGDRLISKLLAPFTTIVTHRPARYLSMFTWIIYYLNKQEFSDKKIFWRKFYELEVVFICAIQRHKDHNYDNFSGRIGGESAQKFMDGLKTNMLDLSGKRISNGWDTNYKNPMYDFNLIETDFGFVSDLRVTDKGEILALSYQESIASSDFFNGFLGEIRIPIKVIDNLAEYSCPCLIRNPCKEIFQLEQNITKESLLSNYEASDDDESSEQLNMILSSIKLILFFMASLKKENLLFTTNAWRRVLSTHFDGSKEFEIPEEFDETFRKWKLYNLESLFVFALESGLSGFLEYLQKNDDSYENELIKPMESFFDKDGFQVEIIEGFVVGNEPEEFISNISELNPKQLFNLENYVINKIQSTSLKEKIFYSCILCIYTQALYLKNKNDPSYEKSIKFYLDWAERDGLELSLEHSINELSSISIRDYFLEIFVKKWIINRQQYTRDKRQKDVAWFSYNNETKTYNWEANYNPWLYRAARSEILMTFLLNLGIVNHSKDGWSLNK